MKIRKPSRETDGDRGSTLLVAMMVMMLAASLGAVVVKVAINTNADSGVDRQRTVAINAAEAGIDATFATIEGAGTSLPCVWPPSGTYDVNAEPDPTQVSVQITYYDADHNQLTCNGGTLPSSVTPASALIDSKAVLPTLTNAPRTATRYMQASVNLVPVRGVGLTNAIFGESTIFTSNRVTVYRGAGGEDGSLYTNGDFSCTNNESFQGSIVAPTGSITLSNSCSFTGDVWAADSITAGSGYHGTIGGRVIASAGSIDLDGGTVGGTLQAAGTISYDGCATANKCFANQSTAAPAAPQQPFPHILGDAATLTSVWQADGWNIHLETDCPNILARIAVDAALPGKTLVSTPCSVAFNKLNETFNGDFALFASGGITSSQHVTFDANGAHNVYMIVPWTNYDGTLHSCPTGEVDFANNFTTTANVSFLVYTPCDLQYSNNNGGTNPSQIYSGQTVTINNQYSMTYCAVPMPTGAIDPATLPTLSYTVGILYKRETVS